MREEGFTLTHKANEDVGADETITMDLRYADTILFLPDLVTLRQ